MDLKRSLSHMFDHEHSQLKRSGHRAPFCRRFGQHECKRVLPIGLPDEARTTWQIPGENDRVPIWIKRLLYAPSPGVPGTRGRNTRSQGIGHP